MCVEFDKGPRNLALFSHDIRMSNLREHLLKLSHLPTLLTRWPCTTIAITVCNLRIVLLKLSRSSLFVYFPLTQG
ncbi:hypothetical protein HMPREF9999_00464 [Alloprevotella sp. oral taxon 473 str. F0040]|nr:hypothetical protein HMPREF9999_00464 [Alloprevotella sp. oral taxon 473 str. F0040]